MGGGVGETDQRNKRMKNQNQNLFQPVLFNGVDGNSSLVMTSSWSSICPTKSLKTHLLKVLVHLLKVLAHKNS